MFKKVWSNCVYWKEYLNCAGCEIEQKFKTYKNSCTAKGSFVILYKEECKRNRYNPDSELIERDIDAK